MATLLEEVSTITAKGQTTIPKSVRHALGVDRGGKIAFRVNDQGVTVIRAEVEHEDPTVDAFLAFVATDMERRPQALTVFSGSLADRIADLTQGISVDLNVPIEGTVDL
jgi:antitoxin PrlF